MYLNDIHWIKYQLLINSCLIFLFSPLLFIVDTARTGYPPSSRQMCTKLQSMLSYGKYQTSQISSNITYTRRLYTQSFLTYSTIDDLLIFIEPKHQIHVYNAQRIQLIVSISTSDVVLATSTRSLISASNHDLFFLYETNTETNLISLRACQVRFNMSTLSFENLYCIEAINIQYDQAYLRTTGFTIKRDHAETNKSLLFIATDLGVIYSIFDTSTGSLTNEPRILNETLNEGSIVISAAGLVYYASRQENIIYELLISRDFRLHYGKVIRQKGIKYPYGLIADECNHLYITTGSMIWIMYVQENVTIRSVFSKPSDLPITLERLNATTYAYTTIIKQNGILNSPWMFNILYFTEPGRVTPPTRHRVVNLEEKLDLNQTSKDTSSIVKLLPISYPADSNTTKRYVQFKTLQRKPFQRFRKRKRKKFRQMQTTFLLDPNMSSIDKNQLFTLNPLTDQSITEVSDESQFTHLDDNLEIDDDAPLDYEEQIDQIFDNDIPSNAQSVQYELSVRITTPTPPITSSRIYNYENILEDLNGTFPFSANQTIEIDGTIFSRDEIEAYLQGRGSLTSNQNTKLQIYLAKQSSSDSNLFSNNEKITKKPDRTHRDKNNSRLTGQTDEEDDTETQDDLAKQPFFDAEFLNRTIDIDGTSFSGNDLRAYLEGRSNFTSEQKSQIQAFLTNQSSTDYHRFSNYLKTKNKTTGSIHPNSHLLIDDIHKDGNTSAERPSFDPKYINHTINIEGTMFTINDIHSYFQGRRNLTMEQEELIKTYLTNQSSFNDSIFAEYLQTPNKTSGAIPPDAIFTENDIRSYLANQGNLTETQKLHIQAYLARQSSTTTSTRKPTDIFVYGDLQSLFDKHDNESISWDAQLIDFLSKLPSSDLSLSNNTLAMGNTTFTEEDIRSYLEGRANLSEIERTQIRAYVAQKLSSISNISSNYFTTTKRPDKPSPFDNQTIIDKQYSNRTTDLDQLSFTKDDLRLYLEGRANISTEQEKDIQIYLSKHPSFNQSIFSKYSTSTNTTQPSFLPYGNISAWLQKHRNLTANESNLTNDALEQSLLSEIKPFNYTSESGDILFTDDDLKSYFKGTANLSKTQEQLIEDYLSKQSSNPSNLFSRYSTTTTQPQPFAPKDNILSWLQQYRNLTVNENNLTNEALEQLLVSEIKPFNYTSESGDILFTDDDLKSYLKGASNLSKNQEQLIEDYLSKQSSIPYSLFSRYSTTTTQPQPFAPKDNILSWLQQYRNLTVNESNLTNEALEQLLVSEIKPFNYTSESGDILFTDDDLKSYLKGASNLSKNQEQLIEDYLSKQSSMPYSLFSRYSTTTTQPQPFAPKDNILSWLQQYRNLTVNESNLTNDALEQLLLSEIRPFNRTSESGDILFTDDDLKSYLKGASNLSKNQEELIEDYLSKQSSIPYNLFSRYSTTTTKSQETLLADSSILSWLQRYRNLTANESNLTNDALEQLLLSEIRPFNQTSESGDILFTDDDLKSYLKGTSNLSKNQEQLIEDYLAKQSSIPYNLFSKYSTSTTKPQKTFLPGRNKSIHFPGKENVYDGTDTHTDDYSEEESMSDGENLTRTQDREIPNFSVNDLRSYLLGGNNLSKSNEEAIQAYLSKNPLSLRDLLFKHSSSTRKPRKTSHPRFNESFGLQKDGNTSGIEDTPLEDYSDELPPADGENFNYTSESGEILFTNEDLNSFLQGQSNISETRKKHIQNYLAKEPSFSYNLFSKYPASTRKPQRTPSSSRNRSLELTEDQDLSFNEKDNLRPIDHTDGSNTINPDLSFSEDDIRSYLEGRGNLTKKQKEEIQAYLNRLESSGQNYTQPINYSTKSPLFDPKYFNLSADSEEILFTVDDFQSYLQGRANLSRTQEEQIQAFLAKQPSLTNKTLLEYFTRTSQLPRTPGHIPLDKTVRPTLPYPSGIPLEQISRKSIIVSNDSYSSNTSLPLVTEPSITQSNVNETQILSPETVFHSIYRNMTSLQKNMSKFDEDIDEYTDDQSIDDEQTSILDDLNKKMRNKTRHKHPLVSPVNVNVSSTLHSSQSHHSLASLSTDSLKYTRSSSSKVISGNTKTPPPISSEEMTSPMDSESTIVLSYTTLFSSLSTQLQSSSKALSMQTTDVPVTSDPPVSSPFTTSSAHITSSITSIPLITTNRLSVTTKYNQYTSEVAETSIQLSSISHARSTEIFTTILPSTDMEITSAKLFDKHSSSSITDQNRKGLISTQSSYPSTSTMSLYHFKSKILSTVGQSTESFTRPMSFSTTTTTTMTTTTTSTSTTTTIRRYRTRITKITRWRTLSTTTTTTTTTTTAASALTTIIPSYVTTTINEYPLSTSTGKLLWHSEWDSQEQKDIIVVQPSQTKNDSETFLSNDLFNQIFHNISLSKNSSVDKLILLNLMNIPPSSWNLSLHTNDSVFLDVLLPTSFLNTTTNLTFTNIEADRFKTNINGVPINLHVDRAETKQFSLKVNATNQNANRNETNQPSSEIVIGHVKSEQFELNLTKSDNMHVYIEEVDSDTAEIHLDNNFCTNDSSLEINLNLKKNGTIRYGNQTPIHIGAVYTRVHMLKDSCDREQPLTLFFDICERQNPCSNGGTCISVMPDLNDPSNYPSDIGHVGYKCQCPLHISGEHCQDLQYPLGYCLNDGILFQMKDPFNKLVEKCFCPKGFRGEHCEENVDNCIAIQCSNRGICIDGIDTYQCLCFDGYYGSQCERKRVQTVLLQAASRSFGVVAILLIIAIGGLVVASDIHTYLTRKHQKNNIFNKIPRVTSELFENSVLLLGFRDAPIEMNDLSHEETRKNPTILKQRPRKRRAVNRRQIEYQDILRTRQLTKFPQPSSRRHLLSKRSIQTIV